MRECDLLKDILDGGDYCISCMKVEDYTMKLMSTHVCLVELGRERRKARRMLKDRM